MTQLKIGKCLTSYFFKGEGETINSIVLCFDCTSPSSQVICGSLGPQPMAPQGATGKVV